MVQQYEPENESRHLIVNLSNRCSKSSNAARLLVLFDPDFLIRLTVSLRIENLPPTHTHCDQLYSSSSLQSFPQFRLTQDCKPYVYLNDTEDA